MAETLPSGVKKFEASDTVNRAAFNENWETIDDLLTTDATTSARGMMSSADKTKLDGVASNANNYAHPNHTGDVTSTGDGATAIAPGVIVDADVNAAAAIGWSKLSKTGSSLADLATRSAGDLSSGTLPGARMPAISGDVTISAGSTTAAITAGAIVNADINASAAIDASKIANGSVSNTEFQYLDGVTSAIQTQLNAKQATITGAATTIDTEDLTASRAIISDSNGKVAVSAVTAAELGYVDGVTSAIQSQLDGKQATLTGGATSIASSNLTTNRALVSDGSGKVTVSDVTATELGYLDGVTSALQTQLGGKQATITGGATTITSSNLTASRALASDASGKVAVISTTSTELGYVAGVTSAIQTQLNGKQATVTGGATTITSSNLTVSRALASDTNGKVVVSSTTSTELGYVAGVTSAIQTQLNAKQATLTGGATTIATSNLTASRALISNGDGKVAVSDVTSTELGYLDGVTSSIQTQLGGKQATITGGATSIVSSNLTASRALVSDASGKVAVSAVTSTELGYVDGVTSAIQTQLNGKMALSGGTFTGGVSHGRNEVTQPRFKDYSETVSTNATTTGSVNLNIANGNVFHNTLTGNTTFTFQNPATSGQACSFTLILIQDSTPRTVTWPASVRWNDNEAPDLSNVNKAIVLTFLTINAGARWLGFVAGNNFVYIDS